MESHEEIRNNKTTIFRILPVQFQPETCLLGKQPQRLAEDEEQNTRAFKNKFRRELDKEIENYTEEDSYERM